MLLFASPDAARGLPRQGDEHPGWVNDLTLSATNALVGGAVAGLAQQLRGGNFLRAFRGGALGGALTYAGRRTVAFDFPAHALVARQINAVGLSIMRSSAGGDGIGSRFVLPYGPLALEISFDGGRATIQPSVHVYGVWQIVRGAMNEQLFFNTRASVGAGAAIFEGCCGVITATRPGRVGVHRGGVVFVEEGSYYSRQSIIAHELTHVLQTDVIEWLWFRRTEQALLDAILGEGVTPQFVRLGVLYPAVRELLGTVGLFRHGIGPLEAEARWIEDRKLEAVCCH